MRMHRYFAIFTASVMAFAASFIAPASFAQASAEKITSGGYLLQVVLGLSAIVALIFALAWVAKRFSRGAVFQGNKSIKVVTQMPLGLKEKLVVVEISGKQLLLGLTAQQISHLYTLAPEEIVGNKNSEADSPSADAADQTITFQSMFKKLTGGDP
jgi:flagellar protein FliO/FliZ